MSRAAGGVEPRHEASEWLHVGTLAADGLAYARAALARIESPAELADKIKATVRERASRPPRWLSVGIGVNDRYVGNGWYEDTPFRDGDLVKVEVGLDIDGRYAEVGETLAFGVPHDKDRQLIASAEAALAAAITAARAGNRVRDITLAIEACIRRSGFFVAPLGAGHAIRFDQTSLDNRTQPWILNRIPGGPLQWADGAGLDTNDVDHSLESQLEVGMVLALEPTAVSRPEKAVRDTRHVVSCELGIELQLPFWRSANGARSAKFIHTVALCTDGPRVITQTSEGRG